MTSESQLRHPHSFKRLDGFYSADSNGRVSEWKKDIGISNTLAWSPDHKRSYFADSLDNKIWVYNYDESTGAIDDRANLPGGIRAQTAGWLSSG